MRPGQSRVFDFPKSHFSKSANQDSPQARMFHTIPYAEA
jgi:hypothetical protein